MGLHNMMSDEMKMLNPSSFSLQKHSKQNGRLSTNTTKQNSTQTQPILPGGKNGTLALDKSSYGRPENNLPGLIPLHLNENLFAASKSAMDKAQIVELIENNLENLHSYPIDGAQPLQEAIADNLHIKPDNVVLSAGSSELLRHIIFYLLKENDTILLPDASWSFYKTITTQIAANVTTFPLLDVGNNYVYDVDVIAAKIESCQPKVVLICSPNNPTGNIIPIEDLLWLVRQYPHVDFILDEAYHGFYNTYSVAQERELFNSTKNRNLFVIRTFSKFYGLANLRIGFAICHEVDAQNLQKIAPVFGLPSLNQTLAAHRLTDQLYWAQVQQEYAIVNAYMMASFKQIRGFTPYKTYANFILIKHDSRWLALEQILLDYGFKIKRETVNGKKNYFRITFADIGTMKRLVSVIRHLATKTTHFSPQNEYANN